MAASARRTLTMKACWNSSSAITASYHAVVKPTGGNVASAPSENDSATTTASGATTKTRVAAAMV